MPRTCTISAHVERGEIDAALVAGMSLRDIAARFGVSKSALARYRKERLPPELVHAKLAKVEADAETVLLQMGQLKAKAINLLLKAEASGDLRTALTGVREVRACIELLSKLTLELADRERATAARTIEVESVKPKSDFDYVAFNSNLAGFLGMPDPNAEDD